MIILKRIPVRRGEGESRSTSAHISNVPEIWCREENEKELLWHAALLQRLGFSSPMIRRLLEKHAVRGESSLSPES